MSKWRSAWAALAIAILALWVILRPRSHVGPSPARPDTAEAPDRLMITDAEQWIERVAVSGEGIVTTTAPHPDAPAREFAFRSQGPLSADGLRAFMDLMDRAESDYEKRLDRMLADATGEAPLTDYAEQLRLVATLETSRLRRDAVQKGTYVTVGLTDVSLPPVPGGVIDFQSGPFRLESGEWGQVVIWTDVQKNDALREIMESLQEVIAMDRLEGLREFHGRPYEERRAWVDRYVDLSGRAAGGFENLSADEIREFLAKKKTLEHLGATVNVAAATLTPVDVGHRR